MIPGENTLAEIVRKFPAAAALFEKFDLDYCCGGKSTLRKACKDEVTYQKIEHALHRMMEDDSNGSEAVHFETMSATELIDHIVNKHHAFIKSSSPVMQAHLEKVLYKHGSDHPEMEKIVGLFLRLKLEMEQHMFKEEHVLFPRIKAMEMALLKKDAEWEVGKSFVDAPIEAMEAEHDLAGNILHEIKLETNHYEAPANACTTYRLCYDELKQFEHDLHQHVHLENNILFPMALSMQQKLASGILN